VKQVKRPRTILRPLPCPWCRRRPAIEYGGYGLHLYEARCAPGCPVKLHMYLAPTRHGSILMWNRRKRTRYELAAEGS
jgi:hypothetical protein